MSLENAILELAQRIDHSILKSKILSPRLFGGESYFVGYNRPLVEIASYQNGSHRVALKKVTWGEGSFRYSISVFDEACELPADEQGRYAGGDHQLLDSELLVITVNPDSQRGIMYGNFESGQYSQTTETVRNDHKTIDRSTGANLVLDSTGTLLIPEVGEQFGLGEDEIQELIDRNRHETPQVALNEDYVRGLIQTLESSSVVPFSPLHEEPKELWGRISAMYDRVAGRETPKFQQDRWVEVYTTGRIGFARYFTQNHQQMYTDLSSFHPTEGEPTVIVEPDDLEDRTSALDCVQCALFNMGYTVKNEVTIRYILENNTRNHKSSTAWGNGVVVREAEYSEISDEGLAESTGVAFIGNDLMRVFLFDDKQPDKDPKLIYIEGKKVNVTRLKAPPGLDS